MLSLKLSKDVSKRSKAENKGKKTPKECVLSLLIFRGWEQDRQGRESEDKGSGTGNGRTGYRGWKVLTSLSPQHL